MVRVSCIDRQYQESAVQTQGNVAIKERNGKAEDNGEAARCAHAGRDRAGTPGGGKEEGRRAHEEDFYGGGLRHLGAGIGAANHGGGAAGWRRVSGRNVRLRACAT